MMRPYNRLLFQDKSVHNEIRDFYAHMALTVNGKPHTWSKKVPPFQAASINYSNVFNLQYSGIFSDHGSKSSM